jgi:hypothetical protein
MTELRPYQNDVVGEFERALGEDRIEAIIAEAFADADFRPMHAEVA